jgi:hypothetical protein
VLLSLIEDKFEELRKSLNHEIKRCSNRKSLLSDDENNHSIFELALDLEE